MLLGATDPGERVPPRWRLTPEARFPISWCRRPALRSGTATTLRFADTIPRNGVPAQGTRQARYTVPVPADARAPIHVKSRLLIRSQWPWMLPQQQELPTPHPPPRVYEIVANQAAVAVRER